jgi:hypothetical protein
MSQRTKNILMFVALGWALLVSLALMWALGASLTNEHYGFGLGFAIILAGLVIAVAVVCRDAVTGWKPPTPPSDVDLSGLEPPAQDD